MDIIEISSARLLKKSLEALSKGAVIALPTDTCYGLSCDATNKKAVDLIYKIKIREQGKPLSVMVANLEMAIKYAIFNAKALELARKYWPGALTLILPLKQPIKLYGTGEKNVGLRVPDHKLCLELCQKLNKPLITTSANLSGQGNIYSAEELKLQFQNRKFKPSLIIDGGKLKKTPPSTVIQIIKNEMKILRPGELKPII